MTKIPIYDNVGVQQEMASTDTVPANNLAPSGSDGDVLTKDSTLPDGKKWVAATGGRSFPFFIS